MRLNKFTINESGKFNNPAAPVIIDFSKSRWVTLTGDKGTGKSTILESLLVSLGALSGEKIIDKLKNKESGAIDINLDFVGNDNRKYEVRVTKSQFKLMYDDESLGSPMTKVKELLGVPGVNPIAQKEKPLKDIIKWLALYSNKNPEEIEKRLAKIKQGENAAVLARATANNSAKGLREYLTNEPMYTNWEDSEKKYKKSIDIKEISVKLEEAGKKSDKYIQNETKVKGQKDRKKQIEDQIAALQLELKTVDTNISVGETWLAANKAAKKEYDEIKEQYDNSAKEAIAFNKWQDIKRKKVELDGFEDLGAKADAKEKGFIQERKELQIEILPDLKGLEIISEDTHEDGGKIKKEGLYRNGVSNLQMSGTEWMEIFLEMFKKNKGRILVVDNAADLGSSFMELLTKLHKDGCYIVVGEMNREQKTLEIEYQ